MKLVKKLLSVNPAVLVLCALPVLVGLLLIGSLRGDGCSDNPRKAGSSNSITPYPTDCIEVEVNESTDYTAFMYSGSDKLCGFFGYVQVKIPDHECCTYWHNGCLLSGSSGQECVTPVQAVCGFQSTWAGTSHVTGPNQDGGCEGYGNVVFMKLILEGDNTGCCGHDNVLDQTTVWSAFSGYCMGTM